MNKTQTVPQSGFTLIELLVVVLIIGILAAIALPMYEKAVERSRMSEAVANVKAIYHSNERHKLATGAYATDIRTLDINIQGTIVGQYVESKYFRYGAYSSTIPAIAWRLPYSASTSYYVLIRTATGPKVRCSSYTNAISLHKTLCAQLDTEGTL